MDKKKTKQKIKTTDSHRFILREGDVIQLVNKTGVEILVTTFPSVHRG